MMDNQSNQRCEACNSHIIVYEQKGKIMVECSYCGIEPEEIDFSIELEDDDIDG